MLLREAPVLVPIFDRRTESLRQTVSRFLIKKLRRRQDFFDWIKDFFDWMLDQLHFTERRVKSGAGFEESLRRRCGWRQPTEPPWTVITFTIWAVARNTHIDTHEHTQFWHNFAKNVHASIRFSCMRVGSPWKHLARCQTLTTAPFLFFLTRLILS